MDSKDKNVLLTKFDEKYSIFVQEYLKTYPDHLVFTEIGLSLQDYMKAFELQKTKGDIPTAQGFVFNTFENCLFNVLAERNLLLTKYSQ